MFTSLLSFLQFSWAQWAALVDLCLDEFGYTQPVRVMQVTITRKGPGALSTILSTATDEELRTMPVWFARTGAHLGKDARQQAEQFHSLQALLVMFLNHALADGRCSGAFRCASPVKFPWGT